MIPCMGGWCAKREGCAHYSAGTEKQRETAPDRLCGKHDDPESIKPEKLVMATEYFRQAKVDA